MLVLGNSTDSLVVILGGAVATLQPHAVACYRDVGAAEYTPAVNATLTNSNNDVTVVAAPSPGLTRVIDYVSVLNNDTAAVAVTIKLDRNGTQYKLWSGTLAVLAGVEYVEGAGWRTK